MGLALLSIECATAAAVLYAIYGSIYRLYLSPVSRFPGRKLAALTYWYEFYYDGVKGGAYVWEIKKMHQEYGPIIRINPHELHVVSTDQAFIGQLYPMVGKTVDKSSWSAGMFGSTEMTFGTIPHGLHRMRRAAFSQFFSKASIRRIEPFIQDIIDNLTRKVKAGLEAGKAVNLVHAYSALTQDLITEYCFSYSRNVLEKPDFAPHYYDYMQIHCTMTPAIKLLPWLVPTLNLLPDWWVNLTNPAGAIVREQFKDYARQVNRVLKHRDEAKHPTVFRSLRDDQDLPAEEKSQPRLVAEATSLVGAGTLTTAHMLAITSYHIMMSTTIKKSLMGELEYAMPDPNHCSGMQGLEHLPYLSAVVNEGLRLSFGVLHRLTRVHPDRALQFGKWTIPAGTPIGMTPLFLHEDEAMFPNPRKFDPGRWLNASKTQHEAMSKYLSNFGRGTRQCVGMNLAYAELYLTLACMFRRLGGMMQLYETIRERDVDPILDYFIPAPSTESKGVRVVSTTATANGYAG